MQIKTNILYNLKTNTLYSFFQEHGILWGTQDIFVIIIQILLPFLLFYFLDSFLKTKDLTFFAFAGGNPPAGDAPSGGGSSGNNDGKDPYKWLKIALGIVAGVTGLYFGVEYFYPGFFGKLINSFKSPAPVTVPEVTAQFLSQNSVLCNPEILAEKVSISEGSFNDWGKFVEKRYSGSVSNAVQLYTNAWNNVVLMEKNTAHAKETFAKALALDSVGQKYVVDGVPESFTLTFLDQAILECSRDKAKAWGELTRQSIQMDSITYRAAKEKLPDFKAVHTFKTNVKDLASKYEAMKKE